jgi:predicted transcriptional regulator
MVKLNKIDEKIIATLKAEGKELTLQEITDKTGEAPKKIFRSLRKLFENELVQTQARKYKLSGRQPKAVSDEEETEDLQE